MSNPVEKSPQMVLKTLVTRSARFDLLTARVLDRHNSAFRHRTPAGKSMEC